MHRTVIHGALRVLLLGIVIGGTAHAQTEMPVRPGERVRVTAPGLPEALFGHVTKTDPAAGVFAVETADGHAQVRLPLSAVSRIDVSRGRDRGKAALIAGGAGLLVGGALGVREGRRAGSREGGAVAAAALGGSGFVIGALAGYAYAPERWRTAHAHQAIDAPIDAALATHARVKRLSDGTIAVAGERDRRRGVMRGAAILGAVVLVFGGIDRAQGEFRTGEYLGAVAGNMAVGGAIGYLLSPRGWQKLPRSGNARCCSNGEIRTCQRSWSFRSISISGSKHPDEAFARRLAEYMPDFGYQNVFRVPQGAGARSVLDPDS